MYMRIKGGFEQVQSVHTKTRLVTVQGALKVVVEAKHVSGCEVSSDPAASQKIAEQQALERLNQALNAPV